jgi:hypothetical protein
MVLATQNESLIKLVEEKEQVIRQLSESIRIKEMDLENSFKFNPLEEMLK